MSEAKHTPGPWGLRINRWGQTEITAQHPWHGSFTLYVPDEYPPGVITLGEVAANARLVAASPRLLAACEAAVRFMYIDDKAYEDGTPPHVGQQLRAAIAKATGTP